jgi:hypothetical protein
MTAADVLRRIELLNRQQQRAVVRLMIDPDDEAARKRYRDTSAVIRCLRMQIAKESSGREHRS